MNINYFQSESLSQDAVHGYIPFSSPGEGKVPGETSWERDLIDSPWIQRLRQIHQLQTAWLVYPTAEHSRFQHVLGAMHLASRAWKQLQPSFRQIFRDEPQLLGGGELPSDAYIESLLRIAALLHDVGHGPFGHFFDSAFLSRFRLPDGLPLTHETLGAQIIRERFADLIRGIRRNPAGVLGDNETLDPQQVAFLIVRPREAQIARDANFPVWLRLLRSLFSGLYTVDNLDFVLRDAYMSGYSRQAFDLDRLLHYSFFTPQGLTIHRKGLGTLIQFLNIRGELFRSLYFHRKVKAIDITLRDLFKESGDLIFPPGNPSEHTDDYLLLTEWTLLTDVAKWGKSDNPRKREIAPAWQAFLRRDIPWKMLAEKHILFRLGERESGTVFTNETVFEAALRAELPGAIRNIPLRFDISTHFHRPGSPTGAGRQNFLYDPTTATVSNLESEDHYRSIPRSFRICRVFGEDLQYQQAVAEAVSRLVSPDSGGDDLTNM